MKQIKRAEIVRPIFYAPTQVELALCLKPGRAMEMIDEPDNRLPLPFDLDGEPVFRVSEIEKFARSLDGYVGDLLAEAV